METLRRDERGACALVPSPHFLRCFLSPLPIRTVHARVHLVELEGGNKGEGSGALGVLML